MPIAYTIDRNKRLIYETWSGEVHAGDLAAYWKPYLADPEVLAIRRTVVDLRAAVIRFSGEELRRLVDEMVIPVLNDRKWTTAMVVGDPVQFGVSRQYEAFAAYYSDDSIFASVAEAEKWISSTGS